MLVATAISQWVITPQHILEDESYYQFAAKNIFELGRFAYLPKSGGWAFLIFLGDALFGINNTLSIHIAQLLGAGALLGIFLLAWWMGLSLRTAIVSTVLFTFVPARLFWETTAESHTASIFFVIWAMAFSFLFVRKGDKQIFFLSVALWVFACLVRTENIGLFVLSLIYGRMVLDRTHLKNIPYSPALFVSALVLLPQLFLGIQHVTGTHWTSGANVSLGNLVSNSRVYGLAFLFGKLHPVLLTVLAVLGGGMLIRQNQKTAFLLGSWFLLMWVMYFSMWFQNYGETSGMFLKTRLFIFFYPPLILSASFALTGLCEHYARGFSLALIFAVCAFLLGELCAYDKDYPLAPSPYTLEMQMVKEIPQTILDKDLLVTCFPETFTSAMAHPMPSTDIAWFLQEPLWRKAAFEKAQNVYLVDDIVSQRNCHEQVSFMKQQGKAVLSRRWEHEDTQYPVYKIFQF